MSVSTAAQAAVVKAGVEFLSRTVPSGIAAVRHWWKGRTILVVGQSRAGKSTFIDYLRYGIFKEEKDTEKTYDVTDSARFTVAMGKDDSLQLMIKSVTDVPGQIGAAAHADLAYKVNPHAILIFTDLLTPLDGDMDRASGAWLKEFCERLETKWRPRKKANKIKSIIVVMNKKDKAHQDAAYKCKKRFEGILKTLHDTRGDMAQRIEIMPCVLVTNPCEHKLVDGVITHLAKQLQ